MSAVSRILYGHESITQEIRAALPFWNVSILWFKGEMARDLFFLVRGT